MKKLLKYGIASLSLATLGVVATATDVPVFGTVIVHAEDGEVVDATVKHSQEGTAETVELINGPLKEAVLRTVIVDKLEYSEVNALLSEAISNGYDQETGESIGVPNPSYLNYDLSQEELDSITRLRVDASTGGEQHYPKITLPVKELDLAELDKLSNLEALELYGTKEQGVSDLDLSHLDSVAHLSLRSHYDYAGHDQVDAAKLNQATQLEFISGDLINLSAVNNLPKLKHLVIEPKVRYVEGNYSVSTTVSSAELQALIDKGQLETLAFTTDSLAELPSFANLKHLRRLKISVWPTDGKAQNFDLATIKDNQFLEALSIEHLDPNSALMRVADDKIVVKEPIFHLTNGYLLPTLSQLSYLNLNNFINLQDFVEPISQLSNLTGLQLAYGHLTDVAPLAKLDNLKELDLTGNKITDVSHLTSLKQLKSLSVRHNKIAELTKIGNLKKLGGDSLWDSVKNHIFIADNPIVTPEFYRSMSGYYELETADEKQIVYIFSQGGNKGGSAFEVYDYELSSYRLFERSLSGELTKPFPTPEDIPQPTPKTLDSTQAPVIVTVSGKDSSAIAGIETSRVTDQAVLAKLPSNLPQVDIELYDIKTVDDQGNFVQITEPATVTLAVDPSRKVSKVFYFLPDTGMVEELEFTRSDDQQTVSFIVTHFSQYGVVYEPAPQTPPADAPKPQTLTVVETRQDENGAVLFTKTHSLVLNPGEEKDLGYNPDRELLVRGGNLYRYGNFEDGATLYFTTRLKPATADAVTPTPTTTEPSVTPAPTAPAAPVATSTSADQVATTRNQLLAQVDQSRLTDAQKGELAVKIAFAETAEELDKLKAELANLTAPADKPAPDSTAKPADQPAATTSAKTLPATGELTREALTAMGLSLVLFSLGLAKTRKTN